MANRIHKVESFLHVLGFEPLVAPERRPDSDDPRRWLWCCAYAHPLYSGSVFDVREILGPGRRVPDYSYQARFCDRTAGGVGWLYRLDFHPPDKGVPPYVHHHDERARAGQPHRSLPDAGPPLSMQEAVFRLLEVTHQRHGPCAPDESQAAIPRCSLRAR